MTNEQLERDYEVVWSGRNELLPPRPTLKTDDIWTAPKRIRNHKPRPGKHKDSPMNRNPKGNNQYTPKEITWETLDELG